MTKINCGFSFKPPGLRNKNTPKYALFRFGFVPNGGRIYYTRRSQPPTLAAAVYQYYEATQDLKFVQEVLPALVKELDWWDRERSRPVQVGGENVTVYFYGPPTQVPRPESYKADLEVAHGMSVS